MGLEFAIDELYASGWSTPDGDGCGRHSGGRAYPTAARAREEFAEAGYELHVRPVKLFGCHQAEWRDGAGEQAGAVVGHTEAEAVVYALGRFRRAAGAG